jgi:hypothetical protein
LELISNWPLNDSPLYVDLYTPHSAGPGVPYLIENTSRLVGMLDGANVGDIITIFRGAFSLRGRLNRDMLSRFEASFTEGQYWQVIEELFYPEEAERLASGKTWNAIRNELIEDDALSKKPCLLIGVEPKIPDYWIKNFDENVLILRRE